jgi:hypothetical protein
MNPSAPVPEDDFSVCPHCWHVNGPTLRHCARCLADMTTLLQESGGRRWTAAVQSPMPVRVGHRLTRTQRVVIAGFVVMLVIAQFGFAFAPHLSRTAAKAVPAGVKPMP